MIRRLRVSMLLILGIILSHLCMILLLPRRCTWCIVKMLMIQN